MRAKHWFLGCLLATAGAAHADVTLAGVKYEEASEIRGNKLQLNGAGIRYKGPFKVYTAGLYVTKKSNTPEDVLATPGAKRMAVTGYCWGGRMAWLYAAHSKAIKAAVAWYGRLVGTPSSLSPTHPMDLVGNLNAPVLGLYGRADTGIPMESLALMQNKLRDSKNKAAKACNFVTYEDTGHAFHADYRATYSKFPAENGWEHALAWFKQHGV